MLINILFCLKKTGSAQQEGITLEENLLNIYLNSLVSGIKYGMYFNNNV